MCCPEKQSLIEKQEGTVQAYSEAVLKMQEQGATLPLAEFQVLYDLATLANKLCQAADHKLRRHVEEHGC